MSDRFSFNGSILLEGSENRLTGDAGALLLREVDDRLGFTAELAEQIVDPRHPVFITHPWQELFRTRLYSMALGHKDQDDLDRLKHDPALRIGVSERRGAAPLEESEGLVPSGLSSQPTQSRLLATLAHDESRARLSDAVYDWAKRGIRAERKRPGSARWRVLDVDSLPIKAHGQQPGSANNGHYHMRCFQPLAVFDHASASCLGGKLRPGNVHTAEGVAEFLLPIVEQVKADNLGRQIAVRGDAGFPHETLLAPLEASGSRYAMRVPNNEVLKRLAKPYLKRPVGRPPSESRVWTHELEYRVTTGDNPWSRDRRVILVVLEKPGELFLDSFFLVTNWTVAERSGEWVLEFYRERGTMEGYIGELKNVLQPALSSAPRPKSHINGKPLKSRCPSRDGEAANEATFLLNLLAYNLLNTARRVMNSSAPRQSGWSLDRLRTTLLSVPARITRHSRYVAFQINEATKQVWRVFLRALDRFAPLRS